MSTSFEGQVRIGGEPCAGAEVLAITATMDELVGIGAADTAGRFEVAPFSAEAGRPAMILVRVRTPSLVVLGHRQVDPEAGQVDVDLDPHLVRLRGELRSDVGLPPHLNVFINPMEHQGVPPKLWRFFQQTAPGVFNGQFWRREVHGETFDLQVGVGSYRLSGEYINHDRPMMTNPTFKNYVVDAVRVGDASAPGEPYGGYTVHMDTDRILELELRVVPDDELVD